ncbi:hypothetical protein AMES_8645 [Amycolatopsis mediterranei S699]|uniref:Uncharacterized protein n=2 Tax=Amycolatopsis mediterranei TaxID=33910 RepID=A0A0H3DIH0_AMYMU|nr:hypothetical protein [Amycolatopsis mediterranei]ADJ50471.1 hypothetical protein AMED_8778 [Amycolatopsis mediterranei U32]AEK47475.1 hypothetical protein RAM_45040 [Amycolatopsis mediterranei S699]AFO82177.1 hypothetical protein AMES_8645 [Amycolatopsis mediterranei S699]AGT89306.1 hypothetical protein B737_8646 [Amycolatopsis mediterranei RB]KDO08143.1 hypothetical protein DV26_23610 [Amycolatopsis mediterranei]
MDDLIPLPSYAPDGLTESDIDAMIAEYFVTAHDQKAESAGLAPSTDRAATHRHVRRISRQTVSSALRGRSDSPGAAA